MVELTQEWHTGSVVINLPVVEVNQAMEQVEGELLGWQAKGYEVEVQEFAMLVAKVTSADGELVTYRLIAPV